MSNKNLTDGFTTLLNLMDQPDSGVVLSKLLDVDGLVFSAEDGDKKVFDQKVSFGLITKACRNILNMGQVPFAKEVGLSKPTIARIETFETVVKPDMAEKIESYLKSRGLILNFSNGHYQVQIHPKVFLESYFAMQNEQRRRKDKKK